MATLEDRTCESYGGDQDQLSDTFIEVKQCRLRLVLRWVTVREDRAL